MNIRARSKFTAAPFSRLEAVIVPLIEGAVQEGTLAVFSDSQSNVPVASGELKGSGSATQKRLVSSIVGYVTYMAAHGAFVELGTGLRGMGTYPYALPQQGVPYTGSWVYDFRGQGWIGHAAQPYLRPALDSARDQIIAAYASRGFRT